MIETHASTPTFAGEALTLRFDATDDPVTAWAEARDQMQTLLDDPARASTEYDSMFGRTTLGQTVDRFIGFDLIVHGWDLARASGQDEAIPAEDIARARSDALALGDSLRLEGVCGPAVQVPDDASEQDQLLGLLGRAP